MFCPTLACDCFSYLWIPGCFCSAFKARSGSRLSCVVWHHQTALYISAFHSPGENHLLHRFKMLTTWAQATSLRGKKNPQRTFALGIHNIHSLHFKKTLYIWNAVYILVTSQLQQYLSVCLHLSSSSRFYYFVSIQRTFQQCNNLQQNLMDSFTSVALTFHQSRYPESIHEGSKSIWDLEGIADSEAWMGKCNT